jgi:hypothetical protein
VISLTTRRGGTGQAVRGARLPEKSVGKTISVLSPFLLVNRLSCSLQATVAVHGIARLIHCSISLGYSKFTFTSSLLFSFLAGDSLALGREPHLRLDPNYYFV